MRFLRRSDTVVVVQQRETSSDMELLKTRSGDYLEEPGDDSFSRHCGQDFQV